MTAQRRALLLILLAVGLVVFAAVAMDAAEPHGADVMLAVLVPVWATAMLLGHLLSRAFDELQ